MIARLLGSIPLLVALPAGAATSRPVAVERVTSEVCSFCPPAEAYPSELSQQRRDVFRFDPHTISGLIKLYPHARV
jgi:hypothetical protein